jgi:alpha-galactosidase
VSRLNASVIAGTMMLMSDDLRQPAAKERYRALLANAEVNALAARGKSFRPAESDTGGRTSSIFVLADGEKRDFHVALFNFDTTATVKTLSPERLGLAPGGNYRLYDLWTKTRVPMTSTLRLEGAESRLFRIEPSAP